MNEIKEIGYASLSESNRKMTIYPDIGFPECEDYDLTPEAASLFREKFGGKGWIFVQSSSLDFPEEYGVTKQEVALFFGGR